MTAVVVAPALHQRLSAIAPVFGVDLPDDADPNFAVAELLDRLACAAIADPDNAKRWLLYVGLYGEFPTHDTFEQFRRLLTSLSPDEAAYAVLGFGFEVTTSMFAQERELELVTDRPLVYADFTANFDMMTGIQRVIRHTVPHWRERCVTVCATDDGVALALPDEMQSTRIFDWAQVEREMKTQEERALRRYRVLRFTPVGVPQRLAVPWKVPVLLPEVPSPEMNARLAALARHSGSWIGLVGHDCIPIISPTLVDNEEHNKFATYLELVKYSRVVACVSESVTEEFAGFKDMISPQGIAGPRIVACPEPTGSDFVATGSATSISPKSVVCLGSISVRKNQLAVLEAAEMLWREGLEFQLRFVGAGGKIPEDFARRCERLFKLGRPVSIEADVLDATVQEAIETAWCTVFPSLHEGYGLPVVESLSLGTPVITSNFGSLREITAGDGALLVDPRDAESLVDALRRLLTDDALRAELAERASARVRTTWEDYAASLWSVFMEDE